MADTGSRGGMKKQTEQAGGKQKQGVRPGSTARAKQRHQADKRFKKSASRRSAK
jgi:hypothetical protein